MTKRRDMAYRDERLDVTPREALRMAAGAFLGLIWMLAVLFAIVIVGSAGT